MPHFAVVPGPPRPNPLVLSRARLLRALDDAAAAPLTILRAPEGAGKTTLLQDWTAARERTAAWVSARRSPLAPAEQSAGPSAAFLTALLAGAFVVQDPEEAVLVEEVAREAADGAGLGSVLPRLAHLAARNLLILEDLHLATGFPAEDLVLDLLRAMPGLRIIASTASLGSIEVRRPLLELDIAVIGPAQLAFTTEECEHALAGTTLQDQAEEVQRLTGGLPRWVRFLVLSSSAAARSRPGRQLSAVLDAGAADLAALLSPPAVSAGFAEFLLGACVPEELPAALAARIGGGQDVEEMLSDAEQRGFLTRTADGGAAVIPLLRRAVLASAGKTSPAPLHALQELCGRYFLAQGQPLEALRHAMAVDSLDLATDVIRHHALELFTFHGPETRKLLEGVSLRRLARQPAPALALAVLYNSSAFRRIRGAELATLAMSGARAIFRSMPAAERLLLILVEAVTLRGSGQIDKSAARARTGLQTYLEMPLAERERIGPLESVAIAHLGISLWRYGATEEAENAFTRAASLAAAQHQPDYEGYYHSLSACILAGRGDLTGAAQFLQRCSNLGWGSGELHHYSVTPLRLAQAMTALEAGEPAAAKAALSGVLDQADTMELWPRVRYLDALADLAAGNPAPAAARLEEVLANKSGLPPISGPEHALLVRAQSLLLLAGGLPGRALTAAESLPTPERDLVTARIHLATGQAGKTLSTVNRSGAGGSLREQAEVAGLSVAARLQLESGLAPGVKLELARLSVLYREHGLRLSTALLPAADLERVRNAAAATGHDVGLDPFPKNIINSTAGMPDLTPRELAILNSLVQSGSLAEIAGMHFVSVNTVKSQLRGLYRKLGVAGRDEAVNEALRRGLL
ncbi:LuxR C-terminal-related transcriptional regulator [Arthrobacter koreensis]|uniref:LuxR C-terminal-related transcriptional regulator n=1 Tax=Arthrobacter koreensis TaxID=199136 RepID=UPI0036DBF85C